MSSARPIKRKWPADQAGHSIRTVRGLQAEGHVVTVGIRVGAENVRRRRHTAASYVGLHAARIRHAVVETGLDDARDRTLDNAEDVKAVVISGADGNFCSGGDVREIIGPLTEMDIAGLLAFTRMTGDLVKAIRGCKLPVIAAIDGICAGAGACIAMASDMRFGTAGTKVAFLFVRVGLAGCDMGACAMLPRIIGQGRAAGLLFTGRSMGGEEGERWGFFNRLCDGDALLDEAIKSALDRYKTRFAPLARPSNWLTGTTPSTAAPPMAPLSITPDSSGR